MLKTNGITNKSAERLIVDAGAVYLNLTLDEATGAFVSGELMGATAGGNEFVVQQEIRSIEVDGMKGRGKGLQTLSFANPNLTVNLKEITAANLAKVIVGGEIDTTTNSAYDIIRSKGTIELADYLENVALVGKVSGSDKPVIIIIDNALSLEGIEMSMTDNNEVVIPVTFGGHYDESGEVPYRILYPKEAAAGA